MEPFPTAPLSGRESATPVSLSAVVALRRWEARSPRHLSLQRFHPTAFPFLHRVYLRKNSPASTVLWNAPTPHRPSRRTSFSFAWRYHPRTNGSLPAMVRAASRGRGLLLSASLSPRRLDLGWERSGLPRSWGTPLCRCPALRPRQDRPHQAIRCDDAAPARSKTKAPTKPISGLNHTAWALAVYASQDGSLHHHARLASGYWPGSTGRDWLPAGFQ